MNNTSVRIIEPDKIESVKEVTGFEAEQILRKYGYSENYTSNNKKDNNLTFEEMVKLKNEENNRIHKNVPKPITFNYKNRYNSKVTYGTDDETGFNFKIEISTNMDLPNY